MMKLRTHGKNELVNEELLDLFAFGGDPGGGYQTAGDIVTQTIDGIDLNALWGQYQQVLAYWNQRKAGLVSLLTYPVENLIENVPQVGEAAFEEASEFGEPQAGKIGVEYIQLGYDFKDYDVASRWTWMFLRDADARQVNAMHNAYLMADQKLVFRKVMEAIFDNRNRSANIRNQAYNVYPNPQPLPRFGAGSDRLGRPRRGSGSHRGARLLDRERNHTGLPGQQGSGQGDPEVPRWQG